MVDCGSGGGVAPGGGREEVVECGAEGGEAGWIGWGWGWVGGGECEGQRKVLCVAGAVAAVEGQEEEGEG